MSKTLTKQDILHIAKLANLSLTDDEIERYSVQLSEILKYVDQLGEVDTENVKPMTHTIEATNTMFEDGTENKRNNFDAKKLHSIQVDGKTYFKVNRIM
jgi:aspartyl-tRNA(Asn)/glutamyl-tRNA(Gln) amidotransferase subunit C